MKKILAGQTPAIVLCSVQYRIGAQSTFEYFLKNEYAIVVHWLNPGHGDAQYQSDSLGLVEWLKHQGASIAERSGKVSASHRVGEFRYMIHGWAAQQGLLHTLRKRAA